MPYLVKLDEIGSGEQGFLSVAEVQKNIPFDIMRVYWTYNTPEGIKRGMHAHKQLEQVLFAMHGVLRIELDNGTGEKQRFTLNSRNEGLYIPKMWWRDIWFHKNAVLLSVASMPYVETDYIRSYSEFLEARK